MLFALTDLEVHLMEHHGTTIQELVEQRESARTSKVYLEIIDASHGVMHAAEGVDHDHS